MDRRPEGKLVSCPQCNNTAYAIVPKETRIVEDEETSDGKVWVNCHDCGERFLVYYQLHE